MKAREHFSRNPAAAMPAGAIGRIVRKEIPNGSFDIDSRSLTAVILRAAQPDFRAHSPQSCAEIGRFSAARRISAPGRRKPRSGFVVSDHDFNKRVSDLKFGRSVREED
jgi:hypothetical protein